MMAYGLTKSELHNWKSKVKNGEIAFLTHYWLDERFPACVTVTKAGCSDIEKLKNWGRQFGLKEAWIDYHEHFPHFDLFGEKQKEVLVGAGEWEQIKKFNL
jgi:hypothetical protein